MSVILIKGRPAREIAERARKRGDLWLKSDPKSSPLRLTPEEKAKLIAMGLIKVKST